MELRGIANLGIDHPVGGEVPHALAGNPMQPVNCLHHDQSPLESGEVALERARVGTVAEPGPQCARLASRKPLVTNGVSQLDDRLRSQSTVEVVVQERFRRTQENVVGDHSGLAVDCVGAERRETDRDVLGAFGPAGVSDTLAGPREDRLPGVGDRWSALMINDHRAFQDQRDLVEVRSLEGLVPVGGGEHMGDRDGFAAGVDPADMLVDDLAAGDGDTGGFADKSGHTFTLVAGSAKGFWTLAPQLIRSITSGSGSGREPSGAMKHEPTSASIARTNRSGVSVCSVIKGSPVRTTAPGLACISIPAPAWT